jgi:hypothetical protein
MRGKSETHRLFVGTAAQRRINTSIYIQQNKPQRRWENVHSRAGTIELGLSGLIGVASHPDMQKIRINGFLFQIGHIGNVNSGYR